MFIRKLIPALVLLLLLTGCTVSDTVPTVSTTQTTVTPTIPTTQPPEALLEGVNFLSGKAFAQIPSVSILDERTAVFLTTEYVPARSATVSNLMVLDLYTDTVLAETTLDRSLSMPVQSQMPGFIALFDNQSEECILLGRNLEPLLTFLCPEHNGVFTPDYTTYYFVRAQQIYAMNPRTGEARAVETELTLPVESITDYHLSENVLLLNVHTQYYLTDLCPGAVDLDTGKVLLLTDKAESCQLTNDGVSLLYPNLSSSDLVYTGLAQTDTLRLPDAVPSTDGDTGWCIRGSNYFLTLHHDINHAFQFSDCILYRYGQSLASCRLTDITDNLEPDKVFSLPGGNLLAMDHSRRSTKLVLLCPDKLTFSPISDSQPHSDALVDEAVVTSFAEQAAPVEVPKELAEVRSQADMLEQKYDITILLSNQCDTIISQCGFEINPSDEAKLKNEAKLLKSALDNLEKSLELYPEGFFSQFRNKAHKRGILVLLVEDISAGIDDENVDVLGVTYDMGDWYPIAVDITTRDLHYTYCHEIWHAIENKIKDKDPVLLSDVAWYRCNPPGYTYKGMDEYYLDTEYTFLDARCGAESYFVDSYGKTKPEEDRARLMEYIMASDYNAKKMMEAPALHQKMQIMIDAIRGVFDTTGWEDVYWERFHQSPQK